MDDEAFERLLRPYNPWRRPHDNWEEPLPDYERPIVREVLKDLTDIKQAISITGPRRVGKSTAVKQVIRHLISNREVPPDRVLYFSFDDPEVFASEEIQRTIFDDLVTHRTTPSEVSCLDALKTGTFCLSASGSTVNIASATNRTSGEGC